MLWRLEAVFFSPPERAAYSIFIGEIFPRYCTAIGALWGRALPASDSSNIAPHKVKMCRMWKYYPHRSLSLFPLRQHICLHKRFKFFSVTMLIFASNNVSISNIRFRGKYFPLLREMRCIEKQTSRLYFSF